MSVPVLRFPEFSEVWEKRLLSEFLIEHKERVSAPTSLPVLTSSRSGLMLQKDYFSDRELQNEGEYGVLPRGYFTYRLMSDDSTFKFNINQLVDKGAISKEYPVFKTHGMNSYFLQQKLNYGDEFKAFAIAQKRGGTRTRLYFKKLAELGLTIPTLLEQTKIANFLTAVDEKITQLTQKCELLAQYKKGVMQQIFTQELRFKDDDGQDFPEWEEREVGEVFKVTRGNVLPMTLVGETKTDTHHYPVYSSQTKNNGLSGYYTDYLYEDSITWTTDGANAGDVNYRAGKFYCTNVCGVLISNEGHANACTAALINAVSRKHVSYVGNPKLMNNVMAKITINFPSVKEQTKIANLLTAIDDKLAHTQAQLAAAKQYKQGLLQQMFV